jgi:hypothetical protein
MKRKFLSYCKDILRETANVYIKPRNIPGGIIGATCIGSSYFHNGCGIVETVESTIAGYMTGALFSECVNLGYDMVKENKS